MSLVCLLNTLTAYADETYLCTFGQQQRVISVIYENQQRQLPCEVRYKKQQGTEVLWRSENQVGYCLEQAKKFVEKQVGWGWRCANMGVTKPVIISEENSLTAQQTNSYMLRAHFANALSTVSPFKAQVAMYTYESGSFPKNLQALGYQPSQMQDSDKIRDLKIVDGVIKIKANKNLGDNALIILTPKFVLGGSSLEWRCTTNVLLGEQSLCAIDEKLSF